MTAIDRVRIMVLGDSGVGKTSLVHLVANNEPLRAPSWTVGCSVEVKLHEFKEGTKDQKTYFVEMWDIGGSNNHRNERHVFYNPCHGVILVHDLSNSKSEDNLHKWLQELLSKDCNNSSFSPSILVTSSDSTSEWDSESFLGTSQVPMLVIGTKLNQVDDKKKGNRKFASQVGADEILLDCTQSRYLAAGTSNAVKLSRFFDKVIETKYYSPNRSFSGRFGSGPVSPALSSKFYSPHQD